MHKATSISRPHEQDRLVDAWRLCMTCYIIRVCTAAATQLTRSHWRLHFGAEVLPFLRLYCVIACQARQLPALLLVILRLGALVLTLQQAVYILDGLLGGCLLTAVRTTAALDHDAVALHMRPPN